MDFEGGYKRVKRDFEGIGLGTIAELALQHVIGGSHTNTETVGKHKTIVHAQSGQISNSWTKIKYPKRPIPRIYEAIGNETSFRNMTGGGVSTGSTGDTNKQSTAVLDAYWTSTDIAFLFNEHTNQSSLADGRWKLQLESLNVQTEFVNQSKGFTIMDIYDVTLKHNTVSYITPLVSWDNAIAAEAVPTPVLGSGTRENTKEHPGAKPTDYYQWNKTWKVLRKTTVEMPAGALHRHTLTFRPHRIMDAQDTQTYQGFKGITVCTFVVARGTPGDGTSNYAVPTLSSINLTPFKIIWTSSKKYLTNSLTTLAGKIENVQNLTANTLENSSGPAKTLLQQNDDTVDEVNLMDNDNVA